MPLQRRHSCQNNCSDPYCVVRTVCLVCTHELIMTVSMFISGIIVFGGQTHSLTHSQTYKVTYRGRPINLFNLFLNILLFIDVWLLPQSLLLSNSTPTCRPNSTLVCWSRSWLCSPFVTTRTTRKTTTHNKILSEWKDLHGCLKGFYEVSTHVDWSWHCFTRITSKVLKLHDWCLWGY